MAEDKQVEESPIELEFLKICFLCKEENLTKSIQHLLNLCSRCGEKYCTHFASGVDPQYCKDCCKDVEMTTQEVSVTREKYNPETDQLSTRVHHYKSIKFSGLDWLFYQRKIHEMSDEELSLSIEYHQTLYMGMINERDKRRVEFFHRNAGKKFTIRDTNGNDLNTISTETTIKKTRTVKPREKTTGEVNIVSGLQTLLKGGMTMDQILAAVKRVK